MLILLLICCADPGSETGGRDTAGLSVDSGEGCGSPQLAWGSGGEDMLPGYDCMACHVDGGRAADLPFTLAGSVFSGAACPEGVAGAEVEVVDAGGTALTLVTSALGNFYTAEALVPPFDVRVSTASATMEMSGGASSGACNTCHTLDGASLVWVEP